jgi:hypothetical protein
VLVIRPKEQLRQVSTVFFNCLSVDTLQQEPQLVLRFHYHR